MLWYAASLATALAAPVSVPLQGALTSSAGVPVTGPRTVTFTLYADADRAQSVWTKSTVVQFDSGVFSTALEAGVPALDAAIFGADDSLWLGVALAGDLESEPVRLGWAPYAVVAATLSSPLPWSKLDTSGAPAWITSGYTAALGGGLVLNGTAFSLDPNGAMGGVPSPVLLGSAAGAACPAGSGPVGALRWTGAALELCTDSGWTAVGGGGGGGAPAMADLTPPAPAVYSTLGVALDFTVTFSEPVTLSVGAGVPRFWLGIDGTNLGDKVAECIEPSGTRSTTFTFRYFTATGDDDADGVTFTSALELMGSSFVDDDGAALVVTTLPYADTSGVRIAGGCSATSPLASCAAHRAAGCETDGLYRVDPDGLGGEADFDAWCDMSTDGGGWTLVANIVGTLSADPGTDSARQNSGSLTTNWIARRATMTALRSAGASEARFYCHGYGSAYGVPGDMTVDVKSSTPHVLDRLTATGDRCTGSSGFSGHYYVPPEGWVTALPANTSPLDRNTMASSGGYCVNGQVEMVDFGPGLAHTGLGFMIYDPYNTSNQRYCAFQTVGGTNRPHRIWMR